MSGICGVIRFDGAAVDPSDLERQTRALAHRGPDRVKRWHDGPAGFGHLLMRTQMEDIHDDQPLHHGALSFVCDGRIDNREAIAADLGIAIADLATMADSAVVFAAYRAWGADCADRLIGDFVFAVYDHDARVLTLARDAMGGRHVFTHKGDGFFAFASEKKGLWALPAVPRVLPDELIMHWLLMTGDRLGCDPRDPPPDGIGALPGGSILTMGPDGALDLRVFWTPRADPRHEGKDDAYYQKAYREVLEEAVACRVRRLNRAPGLFFSGGFDSASIVALAGPILNAQGRRFVGAASVMPPGYVGPYLDARPWVEICERFMPHLDVRYVTGEGIDVLKGLDAALPVNDHAPSPNRYINDALYRAIAETGVRVCMDGHGGDYTLNPNGHSTLYSHFLNRRWDMLKRDWAARKRTQEMNDYWLFRTHIFPQIAPALHVRWRRLKSGGIALGVAAPLSKSLIKRAKATGQRQEPPARVRSKREAMLRVLERLQSASMMGGALQAAQHGMEFTQPYHDRRVVELALAIPEEYDLKLGYERYLARNALRDVLPPEFQERKPGADLRAPDYTDMIARVRPQLMAEIDRMEQGGKLNEYFDFARMRKQFLTDPKTTSAKQNPQHYGSAVRAFQWARYIEWFHGHNG